MDVVETSRQDVQGPGPRTLGPSSRPGLWDRTLVPWDPGTQGLVRTLVLTSYLLAPAVPPGGNSFSEKVLFGKENTSY